MWRDRETGGGDKESERRLVRGTLKDMQPEVQGS